MIYLKDGNVPLNLAYDDEIVQEANGTYQLSFKYPVTGNNWQDLTNETFLLADDLHGEQEFFVFEVKRTHGYIQVYANQVMSLLNGYAMTSISVDRVAGQTVMTALAGSIIRQHPFSFVSDIMGRHTLNVSDKSVMEAMVKDKHSILGQWGGDLVREKYAIRLLQNGGSENESLFMYKKNMSSFEQAANIKNLRTRIHFKKTIEGKEGQADQVLAVTVDSPLIEKYSQIYESHQKVEDQDVTDLESLKVYAKNYYAQTLCDVVEDSIEIAVKGRSDTPVRLFDVVSVYHQRYDVDLRLKISKYRYSPMRKKLKSIGFGKVGQSVGAHMSGLVNEAVSVATAGLEDDFDRKLQKEIDNANRAFDAEFDKRKTELEDSIEQVKADAEVYADKIKSEITQEFDDFEREYQSAKQVQDQKVAEILVKTQVNANLATEAKNISNQAKADAANALARANQAKAEAIAEAQRLNTVERQATETKLATAKSQAISEANRLVETAKSLLTGQISGVSTELLTTKEQIKLLATKATVDALLGRVSSAEASLQVQAGQIAQTAKKSELDQATNRLTTAETNIQAMGGRITTEITETKALIPTATGSVNLLRNSDFAKTIATARSFTVRGRTYNNIEPLNWNLYNPSIPNPTTSMHAYLDGEVVVFDESDGTRNWKAISCTMIGLEFPGSYTLSIDMRATGAGTFLSGGFYYYKKGGTTLNFYAGRFRLDANQSDSFSRYHVTFDLGEDVDFAKEIRLFLYGYNFATNSILYIKRPKLAYGKLGDVWSANPADMMSEIESVKTTITQTAEGQQQLSTKLTETAGKVSTAETKINQLVNDVSSKVAKTDFDKVKQTVDSQGTTIAQNTSAIALKAEKTYVDGVKSTADSAKSTASDALNKASANAQSISQTKAELTVAQAEIARKVSQTDFNSATGRLTQAETTIREQAGTIATKMSRTEVEGVVTSKGYQTKADVDSNIAGRNLVNTTTLTNTIEQSERGTTQRIAQVEGKIPTKTSSVNLVANSKINESSNAYGFGARTVNLVAGKTYWFGARAKKTGRTSDKKVLVAIYYPDWPDTKGIYFETTDYEIKFVKFIPKKSGVYKISSYWYPSGGDRTGTADVDWYMVVESDTQPTDWSPAPEDMVTLTKYNQIEETVDSHTQTIGAVGTAGTMLDNISRVVQTANGLVNEVTGANGLKTQVSTLAGSWSVKNLTKDGDILTQANASGNQFLLEAAKIRLKGKTLADEIQAIDGKFGTIFVADGTFGKINGGVINANSINAASLIVDQAFFNKLMANEAYLRQLFAKSAFITQVQAITLSATQIIGGILRSTNGNLEFDLNNSVLNVYSDKSTIRRLSDNQSQFLKMGYEDGTTVTTLGANRKANDESIGTADFTGIQIVSRGTHKGTLRDTINIFADEIRFDGGGGSDDGLHFKNSQWLRPVTSGLFYLGMNDRRWREVHSNEYYINGILLSGYLKSIRACLTRLAQAGATQDTYNFIDQQVKNVLNILP